MKNKSKEEFRKVIEQNLRDEEMDRKFNEIEELAKDESEIRRRMSSPSQDLVSMLAASLLGGTEFMAETAERGAQAQMSSGREVWIPSTGSKDLINDFGFEVLDNCHSKGVKVRLPEGFTIEGTSHSMWSHVKRDGQKIAEIFSKGAFYVHENFCRLA